MTEQIRFFYQFAGDGQSEFPCGDFDAFISFISSHAKRRESTLFSSQCANSQQEPFPAVECCGAPEIKSKRARDLFPSHKLKLVGGGGERGQSEQTVRAWEKNAEWAFALFSGGTAGAVIAAKTNARAAVANFECLLFVILFEPFLSRSAWRCMFERQTQFKHKANDAPWIIYPAPL